MVALLLATALFAQHQVVHGKLTLYQTYPARNVEVISRGSKSTVMTDSLGRFSITCLGEDLIRIKQKAFQPATRQVGPYTDSIHINLVFIDNRKNREIALANGIIDENELLYALDHFENLNNDYCHHPDIYDVINNHFAEVTVSDGTIIKRGYNMPGDLKGELLYVVDNRITNSLDWIVPCEIRTIEIMDSGTADAELYGQEGRYGVVRIETRKPE